MNDWERLSNEEAQQRAEAVRRAHLSELLAKANVVGVGVGWRERGGATTNEVALVVLVRRKVPGHQLTPEDRIPSAIEGVPVDVKEVGDLRAQRNGTMAPG